jgi:hypothetical protein
LRQSARHADVECAVRAVDEDVDAGSLHGTTIA